MWAYKDGNRREHTHAVNVQWAKGPWLHLPVTMCLSLSQFHSPHRPSDLSLFDDDILRVTFYDSNALTRKSAAHTLRWPPDSNVFAWPHLSSGDVHAVLATVLGTKCRRGQGKAPPNWSPRLLLCLLLPTCTLPRLEHILTVADTDGEAARK